MDPWETFVGHLGFPLPEDAATRERMHSVFDAKLEDGPAGWPGIEIAPEVFAAHLAGCLPQDDDPAAVLGKLRAGDLYLACACAQGDPQALRMFESEYLGEVAGVLARLRLDAGQVEEVKQLVRRKLLVREAKQPPRIAGYAGWAPLQNWLRVTVVRTGISLLRKHKREVPIDSDDWLEVPASQDNPELQHLKRHYRGAFKAAFQQALSDLTDRDRNLLRLSYLGGLSIDEIGTIYQVHRATAARWIAGVREKLLKGTHHNLAAKLEIDKSELDSIIGMIQSNLEVSISRFLEDERKAE